jgi:hypothetical protein
MLRFTQQSREISQKDAEITKEEPKTISFARNGHDVRKASHDDATNATFSKIAGRHHKTKTLNLPFVAPVALLPETFLRRGRCVAEMHRLTAGHFAVEYRLGTFLSRSIGFTKRLCPVKSSSEN